MEKRQIVGLVCAVGLFGLAGLIYFSDGSSEPAVPLQKRIVEVPPPATVAPPASLDTRAGEIGGGDLLPGLATRRKAQQDIEDEALRARRLALEADSEKALADIAGSKAAKAEADLRARRAIAAPLKEERETSSPFAVPLPIPSLTAPQFGPVGPAQPRADSTAEAGPVTPRGLAGARLVMLTADAAVIEADGRTVRLQSGESANGYRLVVIDRQARSASVRDARGRTRTLSLDMTAPRTAPDFSQERRSGRQASALPASPVVSPPPPG